MNQLHSNDTAETQAFFEGWKLYDTVIQHNYMCHREMIASLNLELQDVVTRPLRVLELGCGDAWVSTTVFGANHAVEYHGMDLSAPAMTIGQTRATELGWRNSRWIEAAFPDGLFDLKEPYDIILSGFALHHLRPEGLNIALAECRRLLKPGGSLLVYDELLKPRESREEYLHRLLKSMDRNWIALDHVQRNAAHEHILNYDFPLSFEQWEAVATQHGFMSPSSLFLDDAEFYGLFRLVPEVLNHDGDCK